MAAAATAPRRATAPARKQRTTASAPARKEAPRRPPARKPSPRRAPARKQAPRRAPGRRPGAQLIPIAVGTASAVRNLPDSSLMVRMTRGRAWIGVLGLLLAGIVALNVVTLSLAATAGRVDQSIQALDQENSILRSRDAQRSGTGRVRHDASALGLGAAAVDEVTYLRAGPDDVATAAARLAAAEAGY
jgi:hypothetical protein